MKDWARPEVASLIETYMFGSPLLAETMSVKSSSRVLCVAGSSRLFLFQPRVRMSHGEVFVDCSPSPKFKRAQTERGMDERNDRRSHCGVHMLKTKWSCT